MKARTGTAMLLAAMLLAALAGCGEGRIESAEDYQRRVDNYLESYKEAEAEARKATRQRIEEMEQAWKQAPTLDGQVEALLPMLTLYQHYDSLLTADVNMEAIEKLRAEYGERFPSVDSEFHKEMTNLRNNGLYNLQQRLRSMQGLIESERGIEYVRRINRALAQKVGAEEKVRQQAAEDAVHREYTNEEIEAMADKVAVLKTNMGDITLGFFPDIAPNHVDRFLTLSREGVYDGVLFHRVIEGFMIQAGDPATRNPDTPRSAYGTSGTGETLKAEFSDKSHVRGTLAAARKGHDVNSADSQFFIVHQDAPHLDGQYTVYGEVLEGMDVVDAIAAVETDQRDAPVEPVRIEEVVVTERG